MGSFVKINEISYPKRVLDGAKYREIGLLFTAKFPSCVAAFNTRPNYCHMTKSLKLHSGNGNVVLYTKRIFSHRLRGTRHGPRVLQ